MLTIPNVEFKPFPKIPRLNREVIITEKIDGTNACILITPKGELFAGNKNQWITVDKDNHGFAAWCLENKNELLKLGPGLYRGEFYGFGINKNPHKITTKRLALFNTNLSPPSCCDIVPILYRGLLSTKVITNLIYDLKLNGSKIGGKAEGIIIYHTASGFGFKVTCENDEKPKGES